MITVGILRCDVCGAPMYPNPAKQAFCCPFCGNVSAYGMQQSRMKHEHRKLEFTEEGYFSLKLFQFEACGYPDACVRKRRASCQTQVENL